MGSGFSKMKKQARLMQEQFSQKKEKMQNEQIEGISGGGLVRLTISGEKELKSIAISPDCVTPDDVEGLQDLILAAFQDALSSLEKRYPEDATLPPGFSM